MHRPDGDRGIYRDQLRSLMFSLGNLAMCQDYPRSISDLMLVANQPGGQTSTKQEALYLAASAQIHGLIDQSQGEKLQNTLTNNIEAQALLQQAKNSQISDLPPITGYWQSACRLIAESDQPE
jgi:hypothetical protein